MIETACTAGRTWVNMPEIRPFRGIRYNREAIGDISLVVAPPYDVISEAERDSLYNRHPYNVVRLILNRQRSSDTREEQPYERAGQFMERWMAQRVLIRDPVPCLYLYRQRYLLFGQYKECTGLVARVRLEDFSDGGILPHEDIMPKPFEDRMRLLEHTRSNLSMVQALYSDPEEKLRAPILSEMERFPLAQFQTSDGIAHDVWGVSDEKFTKRVTSFLRRRTLYIADGHHRYQTALEYYRRNAGETSDGGKDDPRAFLMMHIVEMENPGLSVLPVHRVVTGEVPLDAEGIIEGLERWFTVAGIDVPRGTRSGQVFHLLQQVERHGSDRTAFGVFTGEPERFYLVTWRQDLDPSEEVGADLPDPYKRLDVNVLHKLVIEKLLQISPDRESVESNLTFTRDPLDAVQMVDGGSGSVAFFANPTKVERVREVADSGLRMPQKSTYFFPKPCSGVLMNSVVDW